MNGFGTIFNFTFREQVRAKGYRAITIILAAILFLLPLILIPILSG
ncbi:MAG: ABC transporter permease, partial [Oscillospiraceae bacterium]|nr:ABC transporter permease [Oscillospiraceae bacterium]